MYLRSLIFCSALIITGCDKPYEVDSIVGYSSQQKTAIEFYKNNLPTLKRLTTKQEMLGWVLKCGDVYKYTNFRIGGVSNVIEISQVDQGGCEVSALLHTHTRQPIGYTVDFFSPEDMKTSHIWDMYLLSQENCNIRFGSKLQNSEGVLLGKLKTC